MATLLDDELERHDGPEPRVLTEDVREILMQRIRPGTTHEQVGDPVALIADRASISTRTVYRVLNEDEEKFSIGLDLADRLCLAAGSHLSHCRLVWPNGLVTDYPTLAPRQQ